MDTQHPVLILGASGIIGQTLRRFEPPDRACLYMTGRQRLPWAECQPLDDPVAVRSLLDAATPSVILNLAGENRPDVVERDPGASMFINVELPRVLAEWAEVNSAWYVHVSTQGVLGGTQPPYRALTPWQLLDLNDPPVNAYGRQKLQAELLVSQFERTIITRLTFVLGIRPFPSVGRENPLESWCRRYGALQHEVVDRWFSPCFAADAARAFWELLATLDPLPPVLERYLTRRHVLHIGLPLRVSRLMLATRVHERLAKVLSQERGAQIVLSLHEAEFSTLAPRPWETTFGPDAIAFELFDDALGEAVNDWRWRMDPQSPRDRALELAMFFGRPEGEVYAELLRGFGYFHQRVTEDFRRALPGPYHDDALLAWYRDTDRYVWELTAYHLDAGFNYAGMCQGIAARLAAEPERMVGRNSVLCLGDGIGDLTLACQAAGLTPIYHDLLDSVTARFAAFRFARRGQAEPLMVLSDDWHPPMWEAIGPVPDHVAKGHVAAVVALDFFEHLPNVDEWVQWVARVLHPGGLFLAQNAFAMGDDEHGGSIPQHLTRNNKYADADPDPAADGRALWDSLLLQAGLERAEGGWWRKP